MSDVYQNAHHHMMPSKRLLKCWCVPSACPLRQ